MCQCPLTPLHLFTPPLLPRHLPSVAIFSSLPVLVTGRTGWVITRPLFVEAPKKAACMEAGGAEMGGRGATRAEYVCRLVVLDVNHCSSLTKEIVYTWSLNSGETYFGA